MMTDKEISDFVSEKTGLPVRYIGGAIVTRVSLDEKGIAGSVIVVNVGDEYVGTPLPFGYASSMLDEAKAAA